MLIGEQNCQIQAGKRNQDPGLELQLDAGPVHGRLCCPRQQQPLWRRQGGGGQAGEEPGAVQPGQEAGRGDGGTCQDYNW